jgi:tripeptidyl-peptidase-1
MILLWILSTSPISQLCIFRHPSFGLTYPRYPDTGPSNITGYPNGTWDKPEMCGAYKPTNVISISYGLGENTFSYHYENRQCQEYMKLGLQGVSVIYASGDSGVSNRGECITPANVTNSTILSEYPGAFSPGFPASCPYLTSVGATMVCHSPSRSPLEYVT